MINQDTISLKVHARFETGTGPARMLRRANKLPAVIYGGAKRESVPVSLCKREFDARRRAGLRQSSIVKLSYDGTEMLTMVQALSLHPVTDVVEHVDFQRVDVNVEMRMNIPVVIINEDECVGIRMGGVANILHRTLAVKGLYSAMPEAIEIDIRNVEIGESIHANDISLPSGIVVAEKEENTTILTITGSGDGSREASEEEEEDDGQSA